MGRDLLWKQNVGLALYKGDERIEVSEPVGYKFENDFKERNPLEGIFEDIPEEEKDDYSVWSYVKWGDLYIKCKEMASLIGKWRTVSGEGYKGSNYWSKKYELHDCEVFVFNSDGTGSRGSYAESRGGTLLFTWTRSGNKITLYDKWGGEDVLFIESYSDSELVLSEEDYGFSAVWTCVRLE